MFSDTGGSKLKMNGAVKCFGIKQDQVQNKHEVVALWHDIKYLETVNSYFIGWCLKRKKYVENKMSSD